MTERPTVVVSGGGTGMGRAIAGSFAADGRPVLILGRREDVLAKAGADLGGGAGPVTWRGADLSDPGQLPRRT
jgi:3-oxoacyl-[acyl-carrier protein] reductase